MAGVTGKGRGKRCTTRAQDDLYRAIRAAVKKRHTWMSSRVSALCDELPRDERRLYGAIVQRDELAIVLRRMASTKRIWTRQQRKGGR